ncbi:MAG TPA: FCD domain-containing protein [Caulobacteraceae bacterium]|jgi:DNA-binding GntR family transcriptional regulator|nr:FCD domain-containing protein [Caulobacteraceae bacterium]
MTSLLQESDGDPRPNRSQASHAYEKIRLDILAGRSAPGERLKILDLAQALAVSPGAVREALSRLVPEGLAVAQDQKGFVVAPLSIEDLMDLTEIRCDIEAAALRRAVLRGDDKWEAGILASAHRLSKSQKAADAGLPAPDWVERHEEFHASFVAGCGSRRLQALHAQLHEQSERYRRLSTRLDAGRDVPGEHQALVDAALDRDADGLVELMTRHIRTTTDLIINGARGPTEVG